MVNPFFMRRTLISLLLSGLVLAGCKNDRDYTWSNEIQEEAVVTEKTYVPAHNDIVPIVAFDGEDFSFSTRIEQVPDKYSLTLSGKHSFTLSEKRFYDTLEKGDKARVSYKQQYLNIYDVTKAEKELKERIDGRREFIRAEKV